jgi:hypothetical protein
MGGLLYTNAWTGAYVQAVEWHKYAGSNIYLFIALTGGSL